MSESPNESKGIWKKLEVHHSDVFKLDLREKISVEKSNIFAPKIRVKIKGIEGIPDKEVIIGFEIQDPHTDDVIKMINEIRKKNSNESSTIVFQFYGNGHTYQDLFKPAFTNKFKKGMYKTEIFARIGVITETNEIYGRELFASAIIFYTHSDIPVYVFDCHSIWSLYDFETVCESFGDCQRCLTFNWMEPDGDGRPSLVKRITGYHLCYCFD